MASVLVLASGGVGSSVVASMLQKEAEINLLFADYGQASASRQWKAVQSLAETIRADHCFRVECACLTTPASQAGVEKDIVMMPEVLSQSGTLGAQLASIGLGWAKRLKCSGIHFGSSLVSDEHDREMGLSNGMKDHQREFFYTLNNLLEILSAEPVIKAEALLLDRSREEIIRLARRTDLKLDQIWYCSHGEPQPCNNCRDCRRWGASIAATGQAAKRG